MRGWSGTNLNRSSYVAVQGVPIGDWAGVWALLIFTCTKLWNDTNCELSGVAEKLPGKVVTDHQRNPGWVPLQMLQTWEAAAAEAKMACLVARKLEQGKRKALVCAAKAEVAKKARMVPNTFGVGDDGTAPTGRGAASSGSGGATSDPWLDPQRLDSLPELLPTALSTDLLWEEVDNMLQSPGPEGLDMHTNLELSGAAGKGLGGVVGCPGCILPAATGTLSGSC